MVAELLARSPSNIFAAYTLHFPPSAMATTMPPSEEFVQPGVAKEVAIEVIVGSVIIQADIAGAVGRVGVGALAEAKAAVVERFTGKLGKYQNTAEDSFTDISDTNDITDNDIDGTPEAKQHGFNQDRGGIVNASAIDKGVKFEALTGNRATPIISITKTTDGEERHKQVSVEELLEAQRDDYRVYIKNLMDDRQTKYLQHLQARGDNWR